MSDEPDSFVRRVANEVTGRVVHAVDPDAVIAEIDIDAIVARIDPNALLARVDPNELLARVDVDTFLEHVDVDRLLDQVDPDRLLDRVDVNRLMSRVDVEQLLAGVDLEAIVRRSGVPEIVAESTNQLAGRGLDLARRQLVALDVIIDRAVDRALQRDREDQPAGPAELIHGERRSGDPGRMAVTGFYTGPVTRLVSAGLDAAAIVFLFTLSIAGLDFLTGLFLGVSVSTDVASPFAVAAIVVWAFTYVFGSHAVAGRSPGKGLVGIRVVSREGGTLGVRAAFVRTLMLPVGALLFGTGLLLVLVHKEQRGLHDLVGRTAVVYDWGDRAAELPGPLSAFLERRSGD